MTWFCGMEKRGTKIHWIDGHLPMEEKVREILKQIENIFGFVIVFFNYDLYFCIANIK
jgi:hypothetical protein